MGSQRKGQPIRWRNAPPPPMEPDSVLSDKLPTPKPGPPINRPKPKPLSELRR